MALDRYERWQTRAVAVTEAALRRIERVRIANDARRAEIRAYVFFSRRVIHAGRGLLRADRQRARG